MASALGNRGLTIRKRIFLTNSIMVLLSLMLPLPGAQGVCAGYGIQSGIVLERLVSFYIPLFVPGSLVCYTYEKMRIKAGEKR